MEKQIKLIVNDDGVDLSIDFKHHGFSPYEALGFLEVAKNMLLRQIQNGAVPAQKVNPTNLNVTAKA